MSKELWDKAYTLLCQNEWLGKAAVMAERTYHELVEDIHSALDPKIDPEEHSRQYERLKDYRPKIRPKLEDLTRLLTQYARMTEERGLIALDETCERPGHFSREVHKTLREITRIAPISRFYRVLQNKKDNAVNNAKTPEEQATQFFSYDMLCTAATSIWDENTQYLQRDLERITTTEYTNPFPKK